MFGMAVALMLVLLAIPAQATGPTLHLNFGDFAFDIYRGPIAPLAEWDEEIFPSEYLFKYDLAPDPDKPIADVYRRKFAKDPMHGRFAGHYAILTTGCGQALQCGALVDIREGKVVAKVPTTTVGATWRPGSGLLVVDPFDAEANENRELHWGVSSTEYYLWNGEAFVFLGEERWPEPKAADIASVRNRGSSLPNVMPIPTRRP